MKLTPLILFGFLIPTIIVMTSSSVASDARIFPNRISLDGKVLSDPPNPTLPREGKPPAILAVTTPNLQLFRTSCSQSKGTILLLPGGAYHLLAIEHEGLRVADLLNRSGYDVAILEYSVGTEEGIRAKALSDATTSLGLIRNHGRDLGLNTTSLGIMGFSAGGHLAARLVHELAQDNPFSTIILIYPAYLDQHGVGLNSEVTLPSKVHAKFFVLVGDKDLPERIASTESYAKDAASKGGETEFHLLKDAPHGFGLQSDQRGEVAGWPMLLQNFLSRN